MLVDAVRDNDTDKMQKALYAGATNQQEVMKSYLSQYNPQYRIIMALSDNDIDSWRDYFNKDGLDYFCFSKKKLWENTIADIKLEKYPYQEKIFIYTTDKDGNIITKQTDRTSNLSDLTESEKLIWAAKPCKIKKTLTDPDMINCYFDINEKYCSLDKNKEIYQDVVNPKPEKSDSLFGTPSKPQQSVLMQIAQDRLDKLNALEEKIKQKVVQ